MFLPDVMQAWSFAAQSNSDKLFTAVSAIVALLLKTLSNHIDFRDNGLLLCKTVLQQTQLRLISRGLSSPKNKEVLISPCLRVLTEIVCFDGGVLARQLYSKRDLTFDMQTIGRNLTLRKALSADSEENIRKPSVRTNTIRYLNANLKFQNEGAKIDILKQGNVMRALVEGIEQDPPHVIADVINTLQTYIVGDAAIPRKSKSYVFNDRNLHSLCQLYRVVLPETTTSENKKPLMTQVHALMIEVCSSPDVGVVKLSGWYPPRTGDESIDEVSNAHPDIDLGLDSLEWYGKFSRGVPIKNYALGEFILTLRPYAYELERQLMMAIFEAAPELVAYFFYRITPNFTFTPKLTTTWIGYASFIFSTVQLPVPKLYTRFGHIPPPIGIVIESIMPQPLNQKILRQCVGSSSDLIKFFAIRIITVAFQKLKAVLQLFCDTAIIRGELWEEASQKLITEFTRRCPVMKDITATNNALRNAATDNLAQREAVARLLSLYYEVTPQVALDQKYDISISLASALEAVDDPSDPDEDKEMKLLEVSHLVKIAHWSPAMSWWSKPKSHKFSPFMSLLRLIVKAHEEPKDIKNLLQSVMCDNGALQIEEEISGLNCLIVSLKAFDDFTPTDAVFEFIDECFQRFMRTPIKYEDAKDAVVNSTFLGGKQNGAISLVWMVLLEQWGFVEKVRKGSENIIAQWIGRFHAMISVAGESTGVLMISQAEMEDSEANDKLFDVLHQNCAEYLQELKAYLFQYSDVQIPVDPHFDSVSQEDEVGEYQDVPKVDRMEVVVSMTSAILPPQKKVPIFNLTSYRPKVEDEKHPALTACTHQDAASSIEEGDLSTLVAYLSSPHLSIRRQTQTALRAFLQKLDGSSYIEKEQITLLINELLETSTPILENGNPFPSLASTWASRAIGILADPTHVLYEKINEYMNLGPAWRVGRMIGYWTDRVIAHPPDDEAEGAYWREVIWLLEWLEDGLRTAEDVEPFRRNDVFERLLALFAHPALNGYGNSAGKVASLFLDADKLAQENSLQAKVRPLILRILARTVVVGGATTLVTRTGVLAWLKVVKGMKWAGVGQGDEVLQGLERYILELCDGERVGEWSAGGLKVNASDVVER